MVGVLHLAVLLACAAADTSRDECQYEGRYFSDGEVVVTREACLRCRCGRGAISCRRKSCEPLPDPPPRGCHVLHRRESCCPELRCPGGAIHLEKPFSNFEEEYPDTATAPYQVCVEGGTAYSAGSAMSSGTACEQCFCLGGTRRCVRPQCLPPPLGCKARPSPGACCPQRYYCEHATTKPPGDRHVHDCNIDGKWVLEGQRVSSPNEMNCSQCFCLRGAVRCQSMACAPALMGCKPILAPGHCCPHQYQCDHHYRRGLPGFHLQPIIDNALISMKNQDRSFRNAPENQTITIITSDVTEKTTPSSTTVHKDPITTIKVKRKTDETPMTTMNQKLEENITTSITIMTTTQSTTLSTDISTDEALDDDSTEQPDGSIKIIINGTINCTAELSSTAITVNTTGANDTKKFTESIDIQPRIPSIGLAIETHTYNPNDIITDRNYNDDFDDNESYTINVTSSLISSLRTNATVSQTPTSPTTAAKPHTTEGFSAFNISKKTKDDYDYNNYNKPTLPPSLPNLKIIPFVAADAVVDDVISSKESLAYPILERDDKYPVYYPSVEANEPNFATRRENMYNPTQFPIFLSKKVESSHYPLSSHGVDLTNEYPIHHDNTGDIITSMQDFTVTAAVGSNAPHAHKAITKLPNQSKFDLQTPAINLFSPPVETEGGFIPKDPEMIDDYYAIYSTTSPGSIVPHLTTSMQLDTAKGTCVTGDGRRVLEGESVNLACSICTCAWGDLHCSQRPCHNPPGCKRRPTSTSSTDLCCGDLICDQDNVTTSTPLPSSTRSLQVISNNTKNEQLNNTGTTTETSLGKNSTEYSDLNLIAQSGSVNYVSTQNQNRTEIPTINTTNKIIDKIYTTEGGVQSTTTVKIEELSKGSNISNEYDDEEEDEGFSFGSVLKLLLSDSYDTTTEVVTKPSTVPTRTTRPMSVSTTTPPLTTKRPPPKSTPPPSLATSRPPFMPTMNQQSPNAIYRIDHLVLGESTAIKKTTPRTTTVPFKPMLPRKPPPTKHKIPATQKPTIASSTVEVNKKTDIEQYTSSAQETVWPMAFNIPATLGGTLLKLAGCNIYGQMYNVGRLIVELSTECQECRCTEIGVQCRQLIC